MHSRRSPLHQSLRQDVERRIGLRMAAWRQTGGSQNRFQLPGPDDRVDLWNVLLDLIAIALNQASGDDDPARFAACLVLHHLEDGVDRLLFGGIDEAAGVDDDNFRVFRVGGQLGTVVVQQTHHHFGVDQVLGAAERDEAHLRFSRGGNGGFENGRRHPSILLGCARFHCISKIWFTNPR